MFPPDVPTLTEQTTWPRHSIQCHRDGAAHRARLGAYRAPGGCYKIVLKLSHQNLRKTKGSSCNLMFWLMMSVMSMSHSSTLSWLRMLHVSRCWNVFKFIVFRDQNHVPIFDWVKNQLNTTTDSGWILNTLNFSIFETSLAKKKCDGHTLQANLRMTEPSQMI